MKGEKGGIRHIVKQSIIGADSGLDVAHLRLHRQAEKIIEESGIPFTFLRPNDFMQNFVNFYGPTIKKKMFFIYQQKMQRLVLLMSVILSDCS